MKAWVSSSQRGWERFVMVIGSRMISRSFKRASANNTSRSSPLTAPAICTLAPAMRDEDSMFTHVAVTVFSPRSKVSLSPASKADARRSLVKLAGQWQSSCKNVCIAVRRYTSSEDALSSLGLSTTVRGNSFNIAAIYGSILTKFAKLAAVEDSGLTYEQIGFYHPAFVSSWYPLVGLYYHP